MPLAYIKNMSEQNEQHFSPEIHLSMWKHYDNLRQSKNGSFLTANSILVAFVGFLHNEWRQGVALVCLLGILVCIAWFLLLARNSAYIKYHREKLGGGKKNFWTPQSWTPRSGYLDSTPVMAFLLFWLGMLILTWLKN